MHARFHIRTVISSRETDIGRWTPTFSKRQLIVGRKWRHRAHERLGIVLT